MFSEHRVSSVLPKWSNEINGKFSVRDDYKIVETLFKPSTFAFNEDFNFNY